MKEFIKKINIKVIIKSIIVILLFFIFIYLLVFAYSFTFEQDKIAIDIYNFNQLEKVKKTLDNEPKDNYPLYGLNKFNSKYEMDIKPIKNCYYVSNGNKGDKFIFGFKLESVFYKLKYKKEYYAYPKYDIPVSINCIGGVSVGGSKLGSGGCFDISESGFIETISNPCQD